MAKEIKDKYGRKIQKVRIYGRDYEVLQEKLKPTKAIRGYMGRFRGRRAVMKPKSDRTKYVQILRSIDVNKDNIPDLRRGQIVGRVSPQVMGPKPSSIEVKVRISNRKSVAAMKRAQERKFRKIQAEYERHMRMIKKRRKGR